MTLRAMVMLAVLGFAGAARAEGWRVEVTDDGLRFVDADGGLELARVPLGRVREVVRHGAYVYAALEAGGIAVIDAREPAGPVMLAPLAAGRRVARLVVLDGQLHAIEPRYEVLAWGLADPAAPVPAEPVPAGVPARDAGAEPAAAPRAEPEAAARPHEMRVVAVDEGRVIFDAGSAQGVHEGTRVKVIAQRLVDKRDLTTGELRAVASKAVTAIVAIEHAEDSRSMAELGRGDLAEPGDVAVVTDEPLSQRLLAPRRAPFHARVGFHARPFLGLEAGSKSGGALVDLVGSWYFDTLPARVELALAPGGFTLGARDDHYPLAFALTGAFTTDYFEIGLGLGALVGNDGPCFSYQESEVGRLIEDCEENNGFTVNQVLRLGALDGLNVAWHSSMFSRPDDWVLGSGRGEINVPLAGRLGLFGAGGGGENGWAFGEAGVRVLVGGTGGPGTVVISASLGYAAILDGPNNETVGGPSVAYGMEWRL